MFRWTVGAAVVDDGEESTAVAVCACWTIPLSHHVQQTDTVHRLLWLRSAAGRG